jgi:hypothetical protein
MQDEIKNLGEEMFSVQQLYFDLNNAALSSSFAVVGLDSSTLAFTYLTTVFLDQYVKQVAADGGVMLGFGVVSDTPFPDNTSLIPTDLNFVVSSYKEDGQATDDFSAYTLNYLIMANDNTMPAAVAFNWNWVEKDNLADFAGSVAINRDTFVDFLNQLLSPTLNQITYKPDVSFSVNATKVTVKTSLSEDTASYSYSTTPDGGSQVLTFSYADSDKDTGSYPDSTAPLNWGSYSLKYTAQSDIYLEGTQIKNVTTVTAHVHMNVDGDVEEGNWAKYTQTSYYTIGIDAYGKMSVTQSSDPVVNNSDSVNPGTWGEIVTAGTIDDLVDSLQKYLKDALKDILVDESSKIADMLNGSNTWVFPGGQTFTFQDAEFSDYQDFIAHVLYIDPES